MSKIFFMRKPGTSDFIVTEWDDLYRLKENCHAIETSLFYDYQKSYCPKCNKMSSIREYDLHHIKMVCGHHLEGITVFYPLEKDPDYSEEDIADSLETLQNYEKGFLYREVLPEDLQYTKDTVYRKKEYEYDFAYYRDVRTYVKKGILYKQNFYDQNNLPLDFLGCSLEFNSKNNKISASFYRIDRDKFSSTSFRKNVPIEVETFAGVVGQHNFHKISYENCRDKEKNRFNWRYQNDDENPFVPEFQWPEKAISFFHEAVNSALGREITYKPALKGMNLLKGSCLYPYEPNFIVTYNYLNCGYIPNCPDVLSVFLAQYKCKPFRTLRKMFQTKPDVLLEYITLLDYGFKKTDIITAILGSEKFDEIYEKFRSVHSFEFFMKSMLEVKSEKLAAEFLKNLNLNQAHLDDSLNMFCRYYDQLTPEFKKNIFKEGFTEYNHNLLAKISYNTRFKMINFVYTKEQLALEDEIDGYRFLLPMDSDKLMDIGQKMHNCVASYRENILDRKCTIVYVVKDDKYVVCIEVVKSKLKQELCNRNTYPSADIRDILKKWHTSKNLQA